MIVSLSLKYSIISWGYKETISMPLLPLLSIQLYHSTATPRITLIQYSKPNSNPKIYILFKMSGKNSSNTGGSSGKGSGSSQSYPYSINSGGTQIARYTFHLLSSQSHTKFGTGQLLRQPHPAWRQRLPLQLRGFPCKRSHVGI